MTNNTQTGAQKGDWVVNASMWLGFASILLWEFSIIPILAIVLGVVGMVRGGGLVGRAVIGLALGIVFLLVDLGHTLGY